MSEDLRRILHRSTLKLAQLKATLYDELIHEVEWYLADLDMDAQRERGPIVAEPTPEAPPAAPTAPEPAPPAAPDPTPTQSAEELLSPPVRRGRGRPRKVDTAEGQPRRPEPEPKPEPTAAPDAADLFGTASEPSADDDFFAPAAGADPEQSAEQDDEPDFLSGLD